MNRDRISNNRGHNLDKELTTKKYVVDSMGKITVLKFNRTLEHYIEIYVGNIDYNLTEKLNVQFIDTTVFKVPNQHFELQESWNKRCDDRNNNGKVSILIKTKISSPTGKLEATLLRPGLAFWYVETSGADYGDSTVFFSIERKDII